ncbi:LytR/AlgR family response regulator transcription factor [Bryobacter aggregatus]|uniref:LytR/AlgR family response regulator transcription factor n=1 Tax=Bryobacter aggregatus TaxID=360054 RepID=UPI0004E14A0B|nr:LytTR family DNA-binding domain-containing protein [Bryobacter aggregatus]
MSLRATATITTVLVDDERLAREELEFLLRDFGDVEVAGVAENGIQALELIEKIEPDLVFLDVQMPGLDGLGLIRRLQDKNVQLPYFVLATAYDQYAIEAFRLEAMDYLLKPIDKERLGVTIQRAKKYLSELPAPEEENLVRTAAPKSKVVVRTGARNLLIDVGDLIYATIEGGVVRIVASGVTGESSYKTIDELQGDLDSEVFWRVHRGYLVNLNRIREVNPWFNSSLMLKMDDAKGTEVPVSRAHAKKLRSFFKL